jgi:nitrite reductase (NADH) small subunit/3-phenylpropionate/trans-cinnamate dioxygenase ferredoxin subunit
MWQQSHPLYHFTQLRMSDFVTVAKVGSIPEGQGITVMVGERLVAVFNSGGQYMAIDDLCPHMGASLGAGEVYEGVVTCPWHAWRFKVCDGTWADSPRIKIDSFEVRVVSNEIQVASTPRPKT